MLIGCVAYIHNQHRERHLMQAIDSLAQTVRDDRIVFYNNGITPTCLQRISSKLPQAMVIGDGTNIGTWRGLNAILDMREPDEVFCKYDSDVVCDTIGWTKILADVMEFSKVAAAGPKFSLNDYNPQHRSAEYRTALDLLRSPTTGEWYAVEYSNYLCGAMQAWSPECIKRLGYVWGPGLYGWEDVVWSDRINAARMRSLFVHRIQAYHVDEGYMSESKLGMAIAGQGEVVRVERIIAGGQFHYSKNGEWR